VKRLSLEFLFVSKNSDGHDDDDDDEEQAFCVCRVCFEKLVENQIISVVRIWRADVSNEACGAALSWCNSKSRTKYSVGVIKTRIDRWFHLYAKRAPTSFGRKRAD
jgi:hypothetical protein